MKKLATLFVALVASVSTFAQVEKGTFTLQPMVGMNVSSLSGKGMSNGKYDITFGSKVGIVGGVEAGYQITDRLGVSLGVLYSNQGAKLKLPAETESSCDNSLKITQHALNIPVLVNFYVWKGLAVKAGVQPGFALSTKVTGDVSYNGKTLLSADKLNSIADLDDYTNTFSLSIPVGVSYDFNFGLTVDARYNIGVTNVVKDDNTSIYGKGSAFQITVGYKFKL